MSLHEPLKALGAVTILAGQEGGFIPALPEHRIYCSGNRTHYYCHATNGKVRQSVKGMEMRNEERGFASKVPKQRSRRVAAA